MVARNPSNIKGLRRANRATARLLGDLAALARPGVTTGQLNAYAGDYMMRLGAVPVFQTEEGFPGCINTSVNDVAVHGVPGDLLLRDGDVLSIDAGMILDGYCGDSTITVAMGQASSRRRRLISTTNETMMIGIDAARPGRHIGDIGHAMQLYAESRGYGVVANFIGHGLGRHMHEPPDVPSVGQPGKGPLIQDGLVITIEPILVEGSPYVVIDPDGWSVRTADGGWAAQFEHTIVVRRGGPLILSTL